MQACPSVPLIIMTTPSVANQVSMQGSVRAGHAGCAGNSKHIQTLISLASLLLASLSGADGKAAPARLQTVNGFLFSAGLDNINIFRLMRWILLKHLFEDACANPFRKLLAACMASSSP